MGQDFLPGALAGCVPRAALILAVCPVEEVGAGAKDLPVEDAALVLLEGSHH